MMSSTSPNSSLSNDLIQRAKFYSIIIEQVYAGKNKEINESQLLGELLKLLSELPQDIHLFCNSTINPISIFCLTIFSFNEQDTINWIQNRFNPILSQCDKCILNFSRGKCNMLQHFAIQRNVPHEHVSKFNDIVCQWRINSLFPVLKNIRIIDDKTVDFNKTLEMAIYEIICNPHMLRLNKNFKNYFDVIFKYLFNSKNEFLNFNNPEKGLITFVPGIIYCWCEGTQEQINWSRDFLKNLHKQNTIIDPKNLTADILQEVYFHLLFIENPANWDTVIITQFWMRFYPIFKLFNKDVFLEYFLVPKNIESLKQNIRYPIESIFILWYNHLVHQYNDKPLDYLLRILKMFLEKLGPEFWNKIEPYSFHSILDNIFDKNIFAVKLLKIQNVPISNDDVDHLFKPGSVSDLLSWTLPFYQSLSESKRIQMVKKVSMAFLRLIANNANLQSLPKACLMNSSTALLSAVLTITKEERSQLYNNEDFQTILFTKTDSRTLLNNPLIQNIVITSATDPVGFYPGLGKSAISVSEGSMSIITKCIDYDILLLCQRTYKLYTGKSISELPMPLTLLENITSKIDLRSFENGPLLAKELLISLRNINGLLLVPAESPTVQKHNSTVASYITFATKLVEKFTDILPKQLSLILTERAPSLGFWSCIFSSNTKLYQAATNILYDTFDVEGRLEGIQSILNNSLTNQLNAINCVLKQLIKCEFYEPCPRAVRVLMDIISSFADPIGGILANYSTLKTAESGQALIQFWEYCWSFMDTIYRCTLTWASKYEYSELENFTKDTLELSSSLISLYREISDILGENNVELFDCVLKTFNNMLYWLRLSDEELLDSCVRLIIATADLAQDKNIKFDDILIEKMAKYASKFRKFSNKLTEAQSSQILAKTRLFNVKITNQIVEEAEKYHREKERQKQKGLQSASPSPSYTPVESKADFLQRKALSSSIIGRPKQTQPKITSFGNFQITDNPLLHVQPTVKPLSRMEQARRQLLNNRIVHPPSTSVFHTRPGANKPKHEDSSDESDSEVDIESARELFASTKSKSKSIETLDINGKPIKKDTLAQQKKMDEENMRKRLNIDLNPLYETILQWNYNRNSEYPTDEGIEKYSDICDEFKSCEEYQRIMRPLLLLECWQGLCSARDREEHMPFSIVVGNRTAVSDFYEVYASVSKQLLQNSGVNESDLIVLAYLPNYQRGSRLSSDDFKSALNTCLAKVRSIKVTKNETVDVTLRIHRNHKFSKFLTLRAEIFAMKVMQMTTVEREFQTLEGLPYYELVNQILLAKTLPPSVISPEEFDRVKSTYKLNLSQAEAIVNSVMKDGFSLIQGPPGTGKTKTILGIIGYFLSLARSKPNNIIKVPTYETSTQSLEQMLKKQKILICAPSNAAVDEICLRLKSGVLNNSGVLYKPNVVRVGRSDAVNAAIKDLTLEELVDKKLGDKSFEYTQNHELDRQFNDVVNKRKELRAKLNAEDSSSSSTLSNDDIAKLQLKIRELSKVINDLGKQRDEIREKNSITYRSRELHRRNIQMQILAGSDIICSTLSGSAHDVLATLGIRFDTVIIDEACQCTELSSIIPLRYGCQRCIMVGDPNQLPPTVLSGVASNYKYNQSLFVRMAKHSTPFLLNVQYRMHPEISRFPSLEFYDGKLTDGPDMDIINKRPWHECPPLTPYKFFNIAMGQQERNIKTMSLTNKEEVRVAIELIDFLFKKYDSKVDFVGKIGIISPYKEQMQKMRSEFIRYFGGVINKYIDFNTIDGFQGQEKEIIIISCVRADENTSSVGFLKDFRRMNVAFTRAKTSLWILGHERSLMRNKLWSHLIKDAHNRHCVENVEPGHFNKKPIYTSRYERDSSKPVSDDHDHYDPMETKFRNEKRTKDYVVDTELPTLKKPKTDEKIEKHDTEERDMDKKKKKKEKEVGTEKKKKKKSKDKTKHLDDGGISKNSKLDKKEKDYDKSENPRVITTGTKKKSSIFGGNTLSDDLKAPVVKTKKKKKNKKPERHISFSDDIVYIPDNILDRSTDYTKRNKIGGKENSSKTLTPINNQDGNNPKKDSRTEDEDDDYNPDDYIPQIKKPKLSSSDTMADSKKTDLSTGLVTLDPVPPSPLNANPPITVTGNMNGDSTSTIEENLVSVDIGPMVNETNVNTGLKDVPKRPSPNPRVKNRRSMYSSSSSNPFIPKKKPIQRY